MKRMAVVLATVMVAACNTPLKSDTSQSSKNSTGPATAGTDGGRLNAGEVAANKRSVYFDFGKATVTREYSAIIQKQAESIKVGKKGVVTLEGNTDERGSAEYNLGLGQRRADAVKKLMVAAGVHASQVKTTSLGKEKPKLSCHDESCWKENRRVDFVQGS